MTLDQWLAVGTLVVLFLTLLAIAAQAVIAKQIHELNTRVATTAEQALAASRDQAQAASAAIAESRRQARLADLPVLHVGEPRVREVAATGEIIPDRSSQPGTHFQVRIRAVSPYPALRVTVSLKGFYSDTEPTPGPTHAAGAELVGTEPVDMDLYVAGGFELQAHYHVTVRYASIPGAEVELIYLWYQPSDQPIGGALPLRLLGFRRLDELEAEAPTPLEPH